MKLLLLSIMFYFGGFFDLFVLFLFPITQELKYFLKAIDHVYLEN